MIEIFGPKAFATNPTSLVADDNNPKNLTIMSGDTIVDKFRCIIYNNI